MRVAIIFYGLTKSLHKTFASIKQYLLNKLTENGIEYDIYIHTYKINGEYTNIWSKETTENYVNEDVDKILAPTYSIYDNQEEIIANIDFNEYYEKLGNWTGMDEEMTKYLIKNLCLALYSKNRITQLFEKNKSQYDYGIVMRPDLLLKTEINMGWFSELTNTNIIIPSNLWFSGCNDHMCIGTPDIIIYYGTLFEQLKEYSLNKSIISERYLFDKLNEHNIQIIKKNIEYEVIRIT
jgi:hypothetical protein